MSDTARYVTPLVQSIRGVGSKKGYPYYAWGVYEPTVAIDGHLYYHLIRSGTWFRSDVHGRHAFNSLPVVHGVRHGSPVPNMITH